MINIYTYVNPKQGLWSVHWLTRLLVFFLCVCVLWQCCYKYSVLVRESLKRKNKVRPESPWAKNDKKKNLRSTQWMLYLLYFTERGSVKRMWGWHRSWNIYWLYFWQSGKEANGFYLSSIKKKIKLKKEFPFFLVISCLFQSHWHSCLLSFGYPCY